MNGKCFEIGTIQAFLDGETTPEVSLRLTDHIAACDGCARLMAEADEENSVVFSALERELNTLVPTQRLWSRINETIETEKSRTPAWQRFLAYVRLSLLNPSLAGAAAVLLALGMFAIYTLNRDGSASGDVTFVAPPPVQKPTQTQNQTVEIPNIGVTDSDSIPSVNAATSVKATTLSRRELNALAQNANMRAGDRTIRAQPADLRVDPSVDGYLPGEESYVKTIADLKQNVDTQKDVVMTPSNRVSYERDMAVVNDSIKRMRDVVKKNPRNQAAKQVLYASYQDKIDLLNSVAQREELLVSLR
jgi:hypothetical protein